MMVKTWMALISKMESSIWATDLWPEIKLNMSIMMVHFNCQLTQPRFIWEETINVALAMLGGTTDMSVENCPKKLILKVDIPWMWSALLDGLDSHEIYKQINLTNEIRFNAFILCSWHRYDILCFYLDILVIMNHSLGIICLTKCFYPKVIFGRLFYNNHRNKNTLEIYAIISIVIVIELIIFCGGI